MRVDLSSNAKAFKELMDEFIAKARPLIADCAEFDAFKADDAHQCLDEIDGFAQTILDHMRIGAMDAEDAAAAADRPLEPGEHFIRRPVRYPYPHAAE